VDLGTLELDGNWSYAKRMNNRGDVVGESADSTWGSAPFVSLCEVKDGALEWKMYNVNEFVAPELRNRVILGAANDINDYRQVVGYGYHWSDGPDYVSYAYRLTLPEAPDQYGVLEYLHEIDSGLAGRAFAINNAGDVYLELSVSGVGHEYSLRKEGQEPKFYTVPSFNGSYLWPAAISERNDEGHVTVVGSRSHRALRYSTATGKTEAISPAWVHNRLSSDATFYDVDNQGRIVGWTDVNRDDRVAARYSDADGWKTLGSISTSSTRKNGWASATSCDGYWVVGASATGEPSTSHAFVYTDQLGMRNLEKLIGNKGNLTGESLHPVDVNVHGMISGPPWAGVASVVPRAFVLLPTP
jgi:probable HAF family extracellular repeat protein